MAKDKVGSVMIVGGGIAGIQAALDLADSGFKVYIVERTPTLGGVMARLDKTFPTNDCSMCILAPKLVTAARHQNIHLFMNSELKGVTGQAGNFQATVHTRARHVDETKCIGCGTCAQKCPKKVPSEFDEGLGIRKAIYVPFPQAVPLIYTIDANECLQLTKGKCGTCAKVCPAGAIDYAQKDKDTTVDVGSMLLMPGFDCFDPSVIKELGYEACSNVITSIEFERVLCASGPFGGHVVRPSDDKPPKRVAFVQCVGSRDELRNAPYCSSVCCMYSIKEAIIAKEHAKDIEATIFFIDIRAFGKDFEKYYLRAQNEYGIRFVRSRVADVLEVPETKNLVVRFVQDNKTKEEEFDMVVLAVGFRPPAVAKDLSSKLGIKLNEYGFCGTTSFEPLDTNVPGIFVGGAFAGPRDIPETVANASGAAAKASSVISSSRGALVKKKDYPKEIDVKKGDEPRIGVFICRCGINIAQTVDVPAVVEYAKTLPNVVFASDNIYTCSGDTQNKIKDLIKEHKLNRILVASCTPRTHEPLFQNTLREAGLNPYLFEMVNIREHVSWVHMNDKVGATKKAKDLVRMGVAKSRLHEPLYKSYLDVKKGALVLGGGLAGMIAALGLAAQGFPVHLVEKENELGGLLRRIYTLPGSKEDPQAHLKKLVERIKACKLVTLHMGARFKALEGSIGAFKTTVEAGGKETSFEHGVIIVATGALEHRPDEYMYGKNPNVLTQLELEERLVKGGVKGKTFVMIQCVGARNKDWPNCSRICCTEALKNAVHLKEKDPKAEVFVLNRDIRSYGFHEDLYRDALSRGVQFIRYDDGNMPAVTENGGKIRVELRDEVLGRKIALAPDTLVLSVATRPEPTTKETAMLLKVPTTADGFFLEAHMKLRPVDFATEGIFLCGLAHGPKFVDEAVSQANAAVSRASTILSQDRIELEPIKSNVVDEACDGCAFCVPTCPYNAITLVEYMRNGEVKKTVEVNEALCKGCGCCMATCPKEGVFIRGFRLEQLRAMIDAALEAN